MLLTRNVSDIPVKEVTKGFVQDFEHFLRMKKNAANNTAVRYLRYLKNVMQYAIANKWATDDPFLGKRFKRTVAEREALTEAELKRMMELELKEFPRLEVVRDTFVFCCFTGLAFIDIQTLKRSDISTDASEQGVITFPQILTFDGNVVSDGVETRDAWVVGCYQFPCEHHS